MAKITKGSALFMIDPEDSKVYKVAGVTGMDPGVPAAKKTDIEDWESRLPQPIRTGFDTAEAKITFHADARTPAHTRLYELGTGDEDEAPIIQFALGWSDGKEAPTVDEDGNFTLPTTRTWYTFKGWVSSFPLDFTKDAVETEMTVQRVDMGAWIAKEDAA